MTKEKVIFNWSSGKDSTLALYKLMKSEEFEIQGLLTSISEPYNRISMHGVRVELLEQQAKSIGLPLIKMQIPEMPTMETYENVMRETLTQIKARGVTASVFGDIFLQDLRNYREKKLSELGIRGVFPLWNQPTDKLIREFIDLGFKTIVTCVNEKNLDKSFAGRFIDHEFLNDLPKDVDPCGENGEFHTFVFDGPIFKEPIRFEIGEVVHRQYTPSKSDDDSEYDCKSEDTEPLISYGFWYCDLLPK